MSDVSNACFPARIEIRAPKNFPAALARAADSDLTTVSEYARRAILNQLRADGIDPAALSTKHAA